MVSELSVTIKGQNDNGDDKRLVTKYLIYDDYTTNENDPIIKDCIEKTLENFDGEADDIVVNIKIEIQ